MYHAETESQPLPAFRMIAADDVFHGDIDNGESNHRLDKVAGQFDDVESGASQSYGMGYGEKGDDLDGRPKTMGNRQQREQKKQVIIAG